MKSIIKKTVCSLLCGALLLTVVPAQANNDSWFSSTTSKVVASVVLLGAAVVSYLWLKNSSDKKVMAKGQGHNNSILSDNNNVPAASAGPVDVSLQAEVGITVPEHNKTKTNGNAASSVKSGSRVAALASALDSKVEKAATALVSTQKLQNGVKAATVPSKVSQPVQVVVPAVQQPKAARTRFTQLTMQKAAHAPRPFAQTPPATEKPEDLSMADKRKMFTSVIDPTRNPGSGIYVKPSAPPTKTTSAVAIESPKIGHLTMGRLSIKKGHRRSPSQKNSTTGQFKK